MTVFANSIMEVMQKADNVKNNQSTKTVISRSMNKEPERTIYNNMAIYRISENNIEDFSFSVLECGITSKLLD